MKEQLLLLLVCKRRVSESRGEPGNYSSKASQALHKEEYVFKWLYKNQQLVEYSGTFDMLWLQQPSWKPDDSKACWIVIFLLLYLLCFKSYFDTKGNPNSNNQAKCVKINLKKNCMQYVNISSISLWCTATVKTFQSHCPYEWQGSTFVHKCVNVKDLFNNFIWMLWNAGLIMYSVHNPFFIGV